MSAAATVLLLWIGFAGSHLVLSSVPVRRRLVGWLGEVPFLGLYSLVALGFFVPLVWVYFGHKHAGDWLWGVRRTAPVVWAIDVGMTVAFFGGFVLFPLVGAWHQDHRKLAVGSPGFAAFHAQTPFVPLTRPGWRQGLRETSPAVVVGGVLLAVVVRYLHRYWTG